MNPGLHLVTKQTVAIRSRNRATSLRSRRWTVRAYEPPRRLGDLQRMPGVHSPEPAVPPKRSVSTTTRRAAGPARARTRNAPDPLQLRRPGLRTDQRPAFGSSPQEFWIRAIGRLLGTRHLTPLRSARRGRKDRLQRKGADRATSATSRVATTLLIVPQARAQCSARRRARSWRRRYSTQNAGP